MVRQGAKEGKRKGCEAGATGEDAREILLQVRLQGDDT